MFPKSVLEDPIVFWTSPHSRTETLWYHQPRLCSCPCYPDDLPQIARPGPPIFSIWVVWCGALVLPCRCPWFIQLGSLRLVCNNMLPDKLTTHIQNILASSLLFEGPSHRMDCLGLAKEWEGNEIIRDRLRSEKKLLVHGLDETYCKPNRKNCVSNADVLGPVLSRLGKHPKKRLPHLDGL